MNKPLTFLRLYVNPAWRRAPGQVYSPLMYPFWGNAEDEGHIFVKELFDAYAYDTNYYGITDDMTHADMVFVPYRQQWLMRRDPALLAECARVAKEAGLPLLVDGVADGEHPLHIENAYVLRIGGHRFLREEDNRLSLPSHVQWEPNKIIIPVSADDLLERCEGGRLTLRHKTNEKPVVGFAGQIKTTYKNMMGDRWRDRRIYWLGWTKDKRFFAICRGIFWRRRAIRILRRSRRIVCNFKTRDFFSGGSNEPNPGSMLKRLQRDFIDNALASDYCLDVRGFANASTRLFEILSLGRIPVILDTERNLPFSDIVDYKKFALIVDFRDIGRLPKIIADFHASLTNEQFEGMQLAARDAYVNYFRVDAQMPHILREINKIRGAELE
jgi:hypothetical protein